ncbi:MAG: hypothetical protein ABWZ82_06545, partial [Candidatus Limnocylindrales bacterium]
TRAEVPPRRAALAASSNGSPRDLGAPSNGSPRDLSDVARTDLTAADRGETCHMSTGATVSPAKASIA